MPTTNDDRWDSSRHDGEPAPNSTGNHELILSGDSETNARYRPPTSTMNMEGLRRRWLLASTLGLVCAVACAAGAWHFLPPGKLSARVLLHVDSIPPSIIFHEVQSQTNFQIYQRTQLALVKSRLVLVAALRKP